VDRYLGTEWLPTTDLFGLVHGAAIGLMVLVWLALWVREYFRRLPELIMSALCKAGHLVVAPVKDH
jgi:hypothetical protein